MIAEDIQVEWDEGGLYLHVDGETWRVADPEQLYDRVKAAILPWLMERPPVLYHATGYRVGAFPDLPTSEREGVGGRPGTEDPGGDPGSRSVPSSLAFDPDESGGYDISDPKHPDFHSVPDIYDQREGK